MVKAIPTTKKMACLRSRRCTKNISVESLGGISSVLGYRLRKLGFTTLSSIKRRSKCMNRCAFKEWMKKNVCANGRQSGMAYKSIWGNISRKTIKRKLTARRRRRC